MEVEQSEDYTCIIAHSSNPKTPRFFGDRILEPCPLLVPDWESKEAEEAELYWLVKGPGDADEEFMRVCMSCKKNLGGDETCIYRYVDAFTQLYFNTALKKRWLLYLQICMIIDSAASSVIRGIYSGSTALG